MRRRKKKRFETDSASATREREGKPALLGKKRGTTRPDLPSKGGGVVVLAGGQEKKRRPDSCDTKKKKKKGTLCPA